VQQETNPGGIIVFGHTIRCAAMAIIAACGLMFSASNAYAQDEYPNVWLNPGFLTYHFDRDVDLREDNLGIGAEIEFNTDHVLMGGTFMNSEDERSRYFGYQWRPLHWAVGSANVHVGLVAAALDGYPRNKDGDWFLVALPLLAVQGDRLGVNLTVIPTIENRVYGAIALQFRLRVW
jgi:hypothetical protein